MAVSQVACSDLFPPPCSGSVSLDTNWNGSSDIVPADSYVAFNFDALSFSAEGHAYSLHGGLRVDYLSAFDTTVVVPANVRFQLTSSNLGGSVDGTVYAPKSRITLFEFDSVGGLTLTTEGRSFSGLSQVSIADANNYSIGTAIVRSAHWSNRNAHVTTTFQDWSVSNGRPLAGSQVTVGGAGGNSIAIEVTASSSSSVVYAVQLSIDGVVKRYTVTAAYPVGGGAATYAAIAISE
jgi:hypothetical protein